MLVRLFNLLDFIQKSPELLDFIENEMTMVILFLVMISFVVLLAEIRLPLKYYWNLPFYSLRRVLVVLGILEAPAVWGYCLDRETSQILPLTAVELLDYDSKEVLKQTFSNRLGQYGFKVRPGKFILRAIKNHYQMPSVLDPENIKLIEVDESFAIPVEVKQKGQYPKLNLPLQPLEKYDPKNPKFILEYGIRTFLFTTANVFLGLAIFLALLGWWVKEEPLFGVLIAVGIVFLFIKIYILETVGTAAGH